MSTENNSVNPKLAQKLIQAQRLIDECVGMLGTPQEPRRAGAVKMVDHNREGIQRYLLDLRDRGFFKQAKVASEVHAELQASFPCELNRVAVALLRMHKKQELRKLSKIVDKSRKTAYAW